MAIATEATGADGLDIEPCGLAMAPLALFRLQPRDIAGERPSRDATEAVQFLQHGTNVFGFRLEGDSIDHGSPRITLQQISHATLLPLVQSRDQFDDAGMSSHGKGVT